MGSKGQQCVARNCRAPVNAAAPERQPGKRKARVALVTEVDFWLAGAGHRARIQALVRHLSQHVALTVVVPLVLQGAQRAQIAAVVPHAGLVSLGLPAQVTLDAALTRLQAFFEHTPQDACIIEYLSLGWLRRAIPRGVLTLVDTHDVASSRDADFLRFGQQPAWPTIDAAQERARLSLFDRVLAICQPDAEVFAEWVGAERVVLVPHAVGQAPQVVRPVARRVLFVGSAYAPNLLGLRWFMDTVWPRVAAAGLTLDVVGTAGLTLSRPLPDSVIVHGIVPDLEPAYAAADLCVNPVRFGSGLKIKTVEALAHGRPLITTTHGMRGLEPWAGRAFVVADSVAEFAQALVDLIWRQYARARLATEGLSLVKSDFSPDVCYGPLLKELDALVEAS